MKVRPEKIERLVAQVDALIARVKASEQQHADALARVHPAFRKSALNLVHYRALRSQDLRDLQERLGLLGLSRLARIESHVLASLLATKAILQCLGRGKPFAPAKAPVSMKRGEKLLRAHTKALLGYRSKGRRVRIMVTLPGEAARDAAHVHDLVAAGMNSARINCAHDAPETWAALTAHVRRASERERRNVKVCMDLGGPKVRTGELRPGPKVVHFGPVRDDLGRVVSPAVVWLAPPGVPPPAEAAAVMPLPPEWLARLRPGDVLAFEDARGKARRLEVVGTAGEGRWAHASDTAYVVTGTLLRRVGAPGGAVGDSEGGDGAPGDGAAVGELPPVEAYLVLNAGDTLVLHRSPEPGAPAEVDAAGRVVRPAHVSCTAHEIFDRVAPGARMLFDDGKIEGVVREVVPGEALHVEITGGRTGGQKLRADKGINLPDDLDLRGLTQKDREDLAFVAAHADVVSMSFVNSPQDVEDLLEEMRRLDAVGRLGVILKIETRSGYDHLTEILLAAMQAYPVGVMIARGDLAIECGWENMARIQEEIMSLCMAAHVPDIWATQVLENLAKKGLPSRAEISDAALAQRSECVMLNKGPHILSAIAMLDQILKQMKRYQVKKTPMLPALDVPAPVA